MTRRALALACAALALAGPAVAQIDLDPALPGGAPSAADPAEDPPPPPESAYMTEQALTRTFTDADYRGCYPDGTEWAERTAESGALYDLLQDGVLVGTWWVEDGQICYYYPARDNVACWRVVEQSGDFYFFYPGTGVVGGTTDCGDPIA